MRHERHPGRSLLRRGAARLPLVLPALLACLLVSCGRHGKSAPAGGSTVPPSQTRVKRNVELGQVRQEKLASYVETVGYLEAEGQTEIHAGVPGLVEEVRFREGQYVRQGEVLVLLDQARYKALVAQAEANVARMEAAALRARYVVSRESVLLDQISRANQLGTGTVKDEEVVRARASLDVAVAEEKGAEKEADAARALLALARHNLERSQVKARYSGQINKRMITNPGVHVEEKTVIGTMADLSCLRLVGFIPEKYAPQVRERIAQENAARAPWAASCASTWFASPWAGLAAWQADAAGMGPPGFQVEFEVRPLPRRTFQARVFYMSTTADPQTHMFECKAEVPQYGLDVKLEAGYSARIRAPVPGNPQSFVVPEECVRATERGFIAYRPKLVRTGDKEEWVAEAISLEIGARQPGFVEVLGIGRPGLVEVLKGLQPGDWIIRKGVESLEDNTPISFPEEQERLLREKMAGR
jgi:membrane fusion protein, multidrug efflux system